MKYEMLGEFALAERQQQQISKLLQQAFPDYPVGQSYYKQLPHFRVLVSEKQQLVGHAAVDYRLISVGEQPFKVFLVGDLCVSTTHQHQHIASDILNGLYQQAKEAKADFLLVVVTNPGLYKKNGFTVINNPCRWLMIHQQTSFGIRQRSLPDSIMVKKTGDKAWPSHGTLDFMGAIF